MAVILKTGPDNFFVNEDNSVSMKYDPIINKYFKYGNNQISSKNIIIQDGGQIIFKDDKGMKYIIDDGYRQKLVSAGYLTLGSKESDTIIDIDEEKSIIIRELLLKSCRTHSKALKNNTRNSIFYMSDKYDHDFFIELESINKLIERNIKRQNLSLPMYPTERGQDKRGLYFRVYTMKNNNSNCIILRPNQMREVGMQLFDKFINELLENNWDTIKVILDPNSTIGENPYKFIIKELSVKRTILRYEPEL